MSTVASKGGRTEIELDFDQPTSYDAEERSYRGAGWVLFAAIMLVMSGVLSIIWGIAAVSSSHFFVAGASYILSDLNTWGWIVMGFGVLEALAALSVWRGGEFGRWFGIVVAGFAGLVAMMSIPAYPFWSLTLVAIAVLVIYGLAAYGGKPYLTR
ncbi:MAG TPA: hypothetical protein VMA96_17200 [Solirubrobacteraceae bacterium]|nr:hypothetical protein [Solirubrobacteraceae bacterium]